MKRRNFLNQIGLLGVISLAGLSIEACNSFSKYKMGLQLFSVRDAMEKDPIETLKKLKLMGYEDFETYGFDPNTNKIYGLNEILTTWTKSSSSLSSSTLQKVFDGFRVYHKYMNFSSIKSIYYLLCLSINFLKKK